MVRDRKGATQAAGRRPPRPEAPVVVAALGAASLAIAGSVLGKAVRDALYLATFPVEHLPYFFLASGLLSGLAVSAYTRLSARFSPQRVVPALAVVSAISMPLLWVAVRTGSPAAVAVLYVWTTISASFLVSGFWAVLGERFDPRSARQLFGLVGAATTLGGLLGGLGAHALLRGMDAETLLLPLGALDLLTALAIGRLAPPQPAKEQVAPSVGTRRGGLREGIAEIARSSYLRDVALLVGALTVAGTLADYVLKDFASHALTGKRELAEFFSLFHGAVGALTLGVQVLACRPLVAKKGLGAALVVLPVWLAAGAAMVLAAPVLWAASALRGGETALRNSFHRAGYELLLVPLPPADKRVVKPILDTLLDRAADAVGAGLVLLLVSGIGLPAERLGWLVVPLAAASLALTFRVRRGYVATLSSSLAARAVELDEVVRAAGDDATSREAIRTTLLDARQTDLRRTLGKSQLGLSLMKSVQIELPKQLPAAFRKTGGGERAPKPPAVVVDDPALALLRDLAHPDAAVARAAVARWDGKDKRAAPFLVRLLARDDLHPQVTAALARAGDRVAGILADHLADEDEPFVVRRRLPRALAACQGPLAMHALVGALGDRRFEVRFHAAGALERIMAREGPRPPAERVWAAVREEMRKSRSMWEAQRLLDAPEDGNDDPLLAQTVSRRGAHSLRHVFRLLGLVLDPKAIELSYRSLGATDAQFRAVGLEYLENVLPPAVRAALWPLIGDDEPPPPSRTGRSLAEVMQELSSSGASISLEITGEKRA